MITLRKSNLQVVPLQQKQKLLCYKRYAVKVFRPAKSCEDRLILNFMV